MVDVNRYISDFKSKYANAGMNEFVSHLATSFKAGNLTKDFVIDAARYAEYSEAFYEENISIGVSRKEGVLTSTELEGEEDISKKAQVTLKYRAYHGPSGKRGSLKGFRNILAQIRRNSDDLSPLYKTIAKDFFKTNNEEVFGKNSVGQKSFKPLNELYAQFKIKEHGPKPILEATGTMRWHLTHYESPDSIHIEGKKTMELGSVNERAIQHATGRSDSVKWRTGGREATTLPVRNPIITGSPRRLSRWFKYASDFAASINAQELRNV